MPWRTALRVEILSVYIADIDGSRWVCCSKCDVAERVTEDGRKVIEVLDHSVSAHVGTDLIGIGHSQDTVTEEPATATVVAPESKVATAIEGGATIDATTAEESLQTEGDEQ